MRLITCCSTEQCGLVVGYELPDGTQICWFHAEKAKLPIHAHWQREFSAWLKANADDLVRASTKRDNYGVLGA